MDAQRVKERLSKNAKRQVETQEDITQRRKINCEYVKRKRLFETQRGKCSTQEDNAGMYSKTTTD